MFDPVDPKQSFPALEHGILKYWKEEDTFKRSLRNRSRVTGDKLDGATGTFRKEFSFYDGPPFATGLPHYGHLLAGTIKDVIPRFQAMQGNYVERRFGWDCHGLPVENIIEKEQNITDHKQIEEMGIGKFNALCREAVLRYTAEWRKTVERMGRWVDMDWDYRTMDPDYMESIWWVVNQLFDKDLIYEGHKPMHVCPRCVTPLSNFEVTQGYKDITDESATVKFELAKTPGTYILAWTTTPWTLPGNLFLAVHPKMDYVRVQSEGSVYILAKALVEKVFAKREFEILGSVKAKDLIGEKYVPLFPYFVSQYEKTAFKIVEGPFVTAEDGTGIVHIAPGFGEDDFAVGKKMKVPLLQHVTMDGRFIPEVTDFAGEEVKSRENPTKTDRAVIAFLKKEGKLFSQASFTHSYPHCWRCETPLLNYATSSWFVAVEKIKEDLLRSNAETKWVPEHVRDGRFGKWLEGARDWAISRNRYWGTPLPIWKQDGGKDREVIGDRSDLIGRNKIRFTKVTAVRHAESEGNLIPVYQGVVPGTPLTPNGKKQAEETAKKLQTETIAVIYASPLERTQETARILAKKTGAKIITDERLREVSFGDYEGKVVDFSDLAFVKARRAHKLENSAPESIYHFPGMETWRDVQERVGGFLKEILPQHRGEHIVIVTHADPIQNIKYYFTKEDPLKLSHQPYPFFAKPHTFYYDHQKEAELDLHKDTIDDIVWDGPKTKESVDVTLVRHGQTDANKAGIIQGHKNNPLNDTGREQILETAKKLQKKKFDLIISSDLIRAKESAEILAQALGIKEIHTTELLRERKYGDWEGKKNEEIRMKLPEPMQQDQQHGCTFLSPPNGETLSEFLTRLRSAHAYILEKFAGKKVLLVAHGGSLQGLSILIQNLAYNDLGEPRNAEALELTFSPVMRRIPEVLDCWFESGSMPYAQNHFPFEGKTDEPVGFPADFIAEGMDQTRGWFYTLTVLSTALFNKPAFYNCIVNGTVLAEDGKKMSKRLKNYPEPMVIVEKHGADAIRFTLMNSPAVRGEDLRISEKLIEEALRSVILPFWNTYSFFVTYANAAEYSPNPNRRPSTHPLDQWVLAEVQDLVNRMTLQLKKYDLSATCGELYDTIDALTNWYVRLSRRRFAGKVSTDRSDAVKGKKDDASDEEQEDALATLHQVLITVSQLLAPFCPFVTEAIYLNVSADDHGSIHLTDWPAMRLLTQEEQELLTRHKTLRMIVSLGLSLRSEKKIKVRQPLHSMTLAIPPSTSLQPEDLELLRQELNIKEIHFAKNPKELADVIVLVDARKTGARLGARVQEIIRAGKAGEFSLQDDGTILILDEMLTPDEASIQYRGKDNKDVAADQGVVVSLDIQISPELALEGEARELIRGIQKLRKDLGYQVNEKVEIGLDHQADDVISKHGELIMKETDTIIAAVKGAGHQAEINDGKTVTIYMEPKNM